MIVCGLLVWQFPAWYPPIPIALAKSAIADRKLDRAELYLNAVTLFVPHDAETWFLRARVFRKQGRLDDVRTCLKRARDSGLPRERIQREEWLAQAQSGQFHLVQSRLSELLTDPRGDEQEICEAYVLGAIRTRRSGFALKLLELWIADFPKEAYPHLLRGQFLVQLEQYQPAAADFRAAIELQPSMSSARLQLSETLIELHQPEESRRVLGPLMEQEEYRTACLICTARSYRIQGEPDLALRAVLEALRLGPETAEAQQEAGRLKLDAGDAAGAIDALNPALEREPRNLETRYLLGQALEMLGRRKEAQEQFQIVSATRAAHAEIQQLTDSVERNPNDAQLRFQIGELTLRYGDPDDGVMWLLSVLDIEPRHSGACRLLADYYRTKAEADVRFRALAEEYANLATVTPVLPASADDHP